MSGTNAGAAGAQRPDAGPEPSVRASRSWWDAEAVDYHREHGEFLGVDSPTGEFVWCPEGMHEGDWGLLGDLSGRRVLEIGCGSAPCSRWLASRGVDAVATDLSAGMLRVGARAMAAGDPRAQVPLLQADARRLPFADDSFDVAFSAFGAIPFVADSAAVMAEVARVLRPGGRFVFSVNHPMRWIFRDDPGPAGLEAVFSYFDRSPYVETDDAGVVTYVEHHRTVGDRLRELIAVGFIVEDLIEPEWPEWLTAEWGQWSPLRGSVFPGTAIFGASLPVCGCTRQSVHNCTQA